MCGIAGLWDLSKSKEELVNVKETLLAPILKRGPDANGVVLASEDPVIFTHSRLSIVDLSAAGSQPMVSINNRYCLSFNGEIYNHEDIRKELMENELVQMWAGHSDTEVLLNALACWGTEKTLSKLKGMYAFALFDSETKKLTLARDLHGEKPLFFSSNKTSFIFSSDPHSFKDALVLMPRKGAVTDFVEYGYARGFYSSFKDVHKLPAGHYLEVTQVGEELSTQSKCYKSKSYLHPLKITQKDAQAKFEELLKNSVKLHLQADVEVGAFLSGGLDSSLVCALAKELGSAPRTFTVGFEEQDLDESEKAARIAGHLGLEHEIVYLTAEKAVHYLSQLNKAYPEPTADHSALPTLMVSELASRSRKVVLTGDGADELFGGYDRYKLVPKLIQLAQVTPEFAVSLAQKLVQSNTSNPRIRDKALKALNAIRAGNTLETVYPAAHQYGRNSHELLINPTKSRAWVRTAGLNNDHAQMLQWDIDNYLVDDVLVKVDRATMMYGLEARSPFLYREVSEFAQSLPSDLRKGKELSKAMLAKYLPEHLIKGPKKGFGLPLDRWFKKGPLNEYAQECLTFERLKAAGFNPHKVKALLSEHVAGKAQHHLMLYAVLCYTNWANQW